MGYPYPQLNYLTPTTRWINIKLNENWRSTQVDRPGSQPCLFVVLVERKEQLQDIKAEYPEGKVSTVIAPDNTLLFWIYDPSAPFAQPSQIKMKTFDRMWQ